MKGYKIICVMVIVLLAWMSGVRWEARNCHTYCPIRAWQV